MENFDRENIDELLEIHQIYQYFPVKILQWTVLVYDQSLTGVDYSNTTFTSQ